MVDDRSRLPEENFPTAQVVFLAFGELGSTVYRSQVVGLVARLAERLPIRLLQLLSPRRFLDRRLRASWERELTVAESAIGRPAIVSSTVPGWADPALAAPLVRRVLARHVPAGPLILHCRGPAATAVGLAIRRTRPEAKVLFDARGARVEELRMTNAPAYAVRWAERLTRSACAESDGILCVSRRLGDYLRSRYAADPARITVTPAGFDERRFHFDARAAHARRESLRIGDRPVLVFSGGWDPWQAIPRNARLLAAIAAARPDAFILALSQDPDRIARAFDEAGIPPTNRRVLRVPFDEVPSYLSASDAGVVLRDPSVVNAVASPVKLAEYLGCGLPVAVSEGLGDAADYVRETNAGVVDQGDERATAAALLAEIEADRRNPERRTHRAEQAARRLSLGANIELLKQLYRTLLSGDFAPADGKTSR